MMTIRSAPTEAPQAPPAPTKEPQRPAPEPKREMTPFNPPSPGEGQPERRSCPAWSPTCDLKNANFSRD